MITPLLALMLVSTPDPLESAYLKELAFLRAEKSALVERGAQLDRDNARRASELRDEVARLEVRLLGLRAQTTRRERDLEDVGTQAASVSDKNDAVMDVLMRAAAVLEGGGTSRTATAAVDGDASATARAVEGTLGDVVARVERARAVRRETAEFFLRDGTAVEGTVVHLGEVAAFGVSSAGSGALAPAGNGRMRLWPLPLDEAARQVERGETPAMLPVVLFDSLDKSLEPKKVKTFAEYTSAGGTIAWVIVSIGLFVLLLAALRALILSTAGARTDALLARVEHLVVGGQYGRALAALGESRGAAARVIRATLAHVDAAREELEDAVSEAVQREAARLERFGSTISVCAAVAPLLGLLGTVTGMIATFDVITEYGTSDPKLLSGGISEALITTEYGLCVAIPALLLGALLSGAAESRVVALEQAALRLSNLARGHDVSTPQATPPTRVEATQAEAT